ncbi:MAG: hypothetical protein IJ069_02590 [Prevotella sp.]|nr:hypothetical protein [Prevotella sp.]
MMKKLLVLLWLTVGVVTSAFAAIGDIKFSRLDTRDGLSNSQLLCVFRDSRGMMWFGTPYGLNRYDGYRFKTFYSYAKDTTTMRNNYVDEIYEAFDGKLWLRQSMNYTIFDPVTEKFDRHPETWLRKHGIKGGIERLFIDSKKDFWVKTYDEGFWHFSPRTGKVKQYRFGYGRQEFNNDFGVSGFTEYGKSVLLSSFNGEIFCFNRDKDWISWKSDYLRRHGFVNNQDCKLRVDNYGNLYAVTLQSTFIKTNGKSRWYHSLPELLHTWGIDDTSEIQSVWDLQLDKQKRLWIATDHHGLIIVDRKTKEVRQFLNDKRDESSISDNTIRFVYRDQLGRMWLGTYMNGVNCYAESSSNFRNLELGNINTICVDKDGYYWLGTNDKGIIRFDPRTEEQVIYDKQNSGIGSNTMVGSLAARDGSVWFGTYEGGLIHIKNGQVTNFRATGKPTDLSNNNVWTICEDQWGYIWIGTLGSGVQRIDPRTGRMDVPIDTKNSIIPSDYISTINRTQKGWLMVSHSVFYSIINPKTKKVINRNIANNHNDISITETSINAMQDSRGLSWQGSASGATIWDPKTNEVYLIDMRSGLIGSTVTGMVEDEHHTMWLVTDHGVSNVVPQKKFDGKWNFVVRSFNNRDGLQGAPYNQRSVCYTPDGKILVGGQGGLDIINPRKMGHGRFTERPVFSGLKVSGREVAVGEEIGGHVVLEKALDACRELSLRYDEEFTVQLASNSGEIHNRSRFIYKMAGYNEEWMRTEEVNPNITYQSLRAGNYYLCVRMMNDDGTMGKEESRVDITIRPPFWRTRWMMLLYMLLVALAAWIWHKWYMKRQERRMEAETIRRELEKKQWMNEMRMQLVNEHADDRSSFVPKTEELVLQKQTDDIIEFTRDYCKNYVPTVENKKVKVNFLSSVQGLEVDFDHEKLAEIYRITFRNAAIFAPNDCQISVGIARTQDNMAQIQIADNGIGIKDEFKEHAFDPIVNGDGSDLDKVKAIVDAHQGDVCIKDNPGGGTIIVVSLPAGEIIEEAEIIE